MKTEADIAAAVRDTTGPLRIVGGGTRGPAARVAGEDLSLADHTGITLYEPGALTLVARTGTPLAEIEATLAAEGQRLAFEPPDMRALLGTEGTPTIGGAIATNASGPRRATAGAARDFLMGVRFVDGSGAIVKNGGRVMKNVTGYDLVKLMAGAHGTLGVLTEVSLKVLPRPETQVSLRVDVAGAVEAVAAMSAALGSPYDVSGAAFGALDGAAAAYVRLEGVEASVRYRATAMQDIVGRFGAVELLQNDASEALWTGLRDATPLTDQAGDIWRVSLRPSDAPRALAALPAGARSLLDWGGGRLWVACAAGTDLRHALSGISGHATLVRGTPNAATGPAFAPEPAPVAALSAGLRAKFDPRGILNPGLMNPGLMAPQ